MCLWSCKGGGGEGGSIEVCMRHRVEYVSLHDENTPIQLYWKFYHQNWKFSDKNSDFFFLFLLKNVDCGYSLEPPRRGGSKENPQSTFLSRNKKNNVYPCKPQFLLYKSGV